MWLHCYWTQELVCFDSGFNYKHFHAAHSWNKWHFITQSPALLLMRFRKKASWIPSNKRQRGTYNLLQHIIPPFYSSYFLTPCSPSWMLYLAYFSIRHPGCGVMDVGEQVSLFLFRFYFDNGSFSCPPFLSLNTNEMAAFLLRRLKFSTCSDSLNSARVGRRSLVYWAP